MEGITCDQCDLVLQKQKVKLKYMKFYMETELLQCPSCGQVYIPEELAAGKILEVEKTLEDK